MRSLYLIALLLFAQAVAVFTLISQTRKLTTAQTREANAFICGRVEGVLSIVDGFDEAYRAKHIAMVDQVKKTWKERNCEEVRKLVDLPTK